MYDYFRFDGVMDADTFNTALLRVGRATTARVPLFDLSYQGVVDIAAIPGVVASVWSMAEFPQILIPPIFGSTYSCKPGTPTTASESLDHRTNHAVPRLPP